MVDRQLSAMISDTGDGFEGILPESISVCLVTIGTYPHYIGGVSTWCDMLVRGLTAVRFTLISLVADPSAKPVYEMPPNVTRLVTVPLWGTGEVLEMKRDLGLRQIIQRKRSAPASAIQSFLSPWQRFVQMLWGDQSPANEFGQAFREMAEYFTEHDYDTTMRSAPVWDCFLEETRQGYPCFLKGLGIVDQASLLDATNAMRLLYRWLTVLTVVIPRVDIVHTVAGGLCSLPGILARQINGVPFLLTEHGIYLRERLLALIRLDTTLFDQVFQSRFEQRIAEICYYYADQVAPGSNYNHRWELHNGAPASRIQTIYNGPDPKQFTPVTTPRQAGEPPTIIWLGRIDPLKDLLTLIRAAALVREAVPDVRFVLYGKAPKGNEAYYEMCLKLRSDLGLEETVIFAGFAASAEAAYNEGDFVVLSSISEGFPYSVVEAMMCGRTVVGTAVGGVPEALEGCGMVVEPRNPQAMAEACIRLLRNPDLARMMGEEARAKALAQFSLQQCNAAYMSTYQHLATMKRRLQPAPQTAIAILGNKV